MFCISNNIIQMGLERLGCFLDRFKARVHCPEIPTFKIYKHICFITVIPQMPQILFNCPCTAHFKILSAQRIKLFFSPFRDVLLTPQPQIFSPLKDLFTSFVKLLVFIFTNFIECIQNMTHHMKTIKNDLFFCIRDISLGCCNIVVPHVPRNGFYPFEFFSDKLFIISLKALLFSVLADIFNCTSINLIDQRLVLVAPINRFFIRPNAAWHSMRFPSATSINRSFQDIQAPVPTETTKTGYPFYVAFFSHFDYFAFKCKYHIRTVFSKLRINLFDSVHWAIHSRKYYMYKSLHLTCVQVTKYTIERMIIYIEKLLADRTSDNDVLPMFQINMNAVLFFFKCNLLYEPRRL